MPLTPRMTPVCAPLLGALSLVCAAAPGTLAAQAAPERAYIDHPAGPNGARFPFSDAVRVGDTLYVAGHLGLDPRTGNAAADPDAEAHLVLDAVRHTLERAGYTMDDLVSVTVYCTDLALYDTFNKAYTGYFHGTLPARAFLGVDKLVRGARFEVQGTAVKVGPR